MTEYEPGVVATILFEVAAFDQTFPDDSEDVSVTEPPSQNVVAPLVEMVGAAGFGFTATFVIDEVDEHPFPSV